MKLLVFLVVVVAFASVQGSWRPIVKRQITFTNCTTEEALAMVPNNCRDDFEDFISDRNFASTDAAYTALICDSGCFRPILLAFGRCEGFNASAAEAGAEATLTPYKNGYCNYNENGERCSSVSSLLNDNDRLTDEWDSIELNCLTGNPKLSLPDPLVCMENCASALTNSVTNVGCCINIYNFTVPGTDYMGANYTNYRLWDACGVQVPGFCSGGTTRATTEVTAGATTMHFSVLLASIMVLIAASLAY